MPAFIELPKRPLRLKESLLKKERLFNNVTFFGDSAIEENDPIYKNVYEASVLLAKNGYTIVNGGGPGIMKAATDGAESVKGHTIGVFWEPKLASYFEGKNISNTTDEITAYSNYMMRTMGLIEKGDVFVVCKGGTGTISEFGMVWCIAKLYYGCHKPVILYGDFWKDLIESIQKNMYIDDIEMGVLHNAKTPEELFNLIKSFEKLFEHCKIDSRPKNDETPFLISRRAEVTKETYEKHAVSYHTSHIGKLVSEEQLKEFMQLVNPPAKVLDIGCGPGYDMKFLSQKYSMTGIEISSRFVNIARLENPGSRIILGDIVKEDIGVNSYKGIWARDSIHHIDDHNLDRALNKIYKSLVEGGIFYCIVREGQGEVVENAKRSYGNLERFYHLFTEQELKDRMEKAGFKTIKISKQKRSHMWLAGIFQK